MHLFHFSPKSAKPEAALVTPLQLQRMRYERALPIRMAHDLRALALGNSSSKGLGTGGLVQRVCLPDWRLQSMHPNECILSVHAYTA
jgi:hypothetical protein